MNVTIFESIRDPNSPNHINLHQALRRIKNGASQERIERVRSGDKAAKNDLPVVCFSGKFITRKDSDLKEHSGLIILDFDHLDSALDTKAKLAADQHILSVWISPSGDGVKALVRITNPERHRDHFRALRVYFNETYGLEVDKSGANESRACYESYDSEIVIKDGSIKFGHMLSSDPVDTPPAPNSVVTGNSVTDYSKINIAARMIQRAADGEKHETLVKAAHLLGGYISSGKVEEHEAVRILHQEICKRDIVSEDQALKSIIDAIEHGKRLPIQELIHREVEVQRQMRINDGDMSFISSDDSDFKWITKYAQGEVEVGLKTGDKLLDEHFRYKRELVVINGHSNVGKTTAALYLMVNSTVRHGWRWIIYSSENKTASVKMTLMQFVMDRKVEDMSYAQRKLAYEWVKDHFVVISNEHTYTYTDILVFAEKILAQQKIDGLFVDPYNSLRLDIGGSSLSSHEYHYEAAGEFLTLSNNHDIAVWLNMHAVTEAQRRKGADGLPVAPYAEDTEGGGKFVNRADCFITIHRKVQALEHDIRKMTEVHIRKVRETETGGMPTTLDDPWKMTINTSHTGFSGWLNRNQLFQPIDFHDVAGLAENLSFKIGIG
jgi:replicative DNA helicase